MGVAKWALAAVSIAFLMPNIGSGLWRYSPPNPPFFTTHEYRTVLRRGETVLVLPYGFKGFSMLWLAETGMWFRMTGGYLNPEPPADYATDPLCPSSPAGPSRTSSPFAFFSSVRHVSAVIVDPTEAPQWPEALAGLGLKPIPIGGILLYRVNRGSLPCSNPPGPTPYSC